MELIALLPLDVMLNGFPALQVFFQLFTLKRLHMDTYVQ
jgi:hypothetical protein